MKRFYQQDGESFGVYSARCANYIKNEGIFNGRFMEVFGEGQDWDWVELQSPTTAVDKLREPCPCCAEDFRLMTLSRVDKINEAKRIWHAMDYDTFTDQELKCFLLGAKLKEQSLVRQDD